MKKLIDKLVYYDNINRMILNRMVATSDIDLKNACLEKFNRNLDNIEKILEELSGKVKS